VIVIASGGGGIPVVRTKNGEFKGVEGVIDKDLAAQRLAADIGAEYLIMLTDVDRVAVNYDKPGQRFLDHLDLAEGRRLLREGHFAAGSMGPKVESALKHIEAGGELAAIGALENTYLVSTGCSGTRVTLKGPADRKEIVP
jgi:carbamate kinase